LQSKSVTGINERSPSLEKVLSALAHSDAIKIFNEALNGIESSTRVIKKLGLSQKRYYTRLNELIKAGLITKEGEVYKLTMFGKLCYKMGERFVEVLGKYDKIALMEKIRQSKSLSLEEVDSLSRILAKDIIDTFDVTSILEFVRVADTWEKVVDYTVEYLDKAKEAVYFATQYFDIRVVEAFIRALRRGVKMIVLNGELESFTSRMQIVRSMIFNPKALHFFIETLNSPDFQYRFVELPYTLMVVDSKHSMVEIAKPYSKTFSLAFFFSSEKLSRKLIESFNALWKHATPAKNALKEIFGLHSAPTKVASRISKRLESKTKSSTSP